MAQINKPTDYFNTVLYDGTAAEQSITGVGFQPDFTWVKHRQDARSHGLVDAVRGATKYLKSDSTAAEITDAQSLKSFDSDGFTLGTDQNVFNESGGTPKHVAWNWLAGGSASSNTDGSITSSVNANTTSGFSIVSYTGTGSAATVGHGLSQKLDLVIIKNRTNAEDFATYTDVIDGSYDYLELNQTNAKVDSGVTPFGSNVFSVENALSIGASSNNYIAYCFHSVKGYSKIGSYTGNGSTDGMFVYTGFKPAFLILKRTDSADSWMTLDSVRNTSNLVNKRLQPDLDNIEATTTTLDFTSNGFKLRSLSGQVNGSGGSYIYMAFAENPLVGTNNIPATAR